MKDKIKFIEKLKVCWYWLFNHGDGIMVHCYFCKSTQLTIKSQLKKDNTYVSTYKCRKCGAAAKNKEEWTR